MHILFDGLNIKRGGGVTILKRLLDAFHEVNIRTTVLSCSAEISDMLRAEFPDSSVKYHPDLSSMPRTVFFRHFKMNTFCKEAGVDVVFSFNYWSPVSLSQVTYHVNVIPFLDIKQRVAFVGAMRAVLHRYYSGMAISRSHLNVFESNHVLELAREEHGDIVNPVVRYIGVDGHPSIKQSTKTQNKIIAITSGNRYKRNDLLISLHRILNSRDNIASVELVIGGFGKGQELRKQFDANDIAYINSSENIRFLGYCTREELYTELQNSLALVTFSELESFYMVALEAMTVGCPVIASRISSAQESMGDAGLLVDHGDIESAADYVVALMDQDYRQKQCMKALDWVKGFRSEECALEVAKTVVSQFSTRTNPSPSTVN